MKIIILFIAFGLTDFASFCQTKGNFNEWFVNETLRLDLNHVGSTAQENFSIQSIRKEGIWAGSWNNLFDTLNLGEYYFVVNDAKTNLPLFSSGFSSGFESDENLTVANDCIRFPFPKKTVQISIQKRNKNNIGFHEIFHKLIDPSNSTINKFPPISNAISNVIFENGKPSNKVDIVILGDGYKDLDTAKFFTDAKKAADFLFSVSPYKENKSSFNVRSVFVSSLQSGITSPLDNVWRNTIYGSSYNSGNIERRIDIKNNIALHDAAAVVPYDFIIILTNSNRYGGIGIYHNYSIAAINSAWSKYLVVHEFGHNFAGLSDEYFTFASCSTDEQIEPWEPNVTGDTVNLKWKNLISSESPIPTLWDKKRYAEFDQTFAKGYFKLRNNRATEEVVNKYIDTSLSKAIKILQDEKFYKKIGAFEGAKGQSCGLYRPEINCTMFTLISDDFCKVCSDAIKRIITFYCN